jgi:ankyrin repeat protein
LMVASCRGHFEVVKWLLTDEYFHRDNINTKDNDGYTALKEAINRKKDDCATLLREHGAK